METKIRRRKKPYRTCRASRHKDEIVIAEDMKKDIRYRKRKSDSRNIFDHIEHPSFVLFLTKKGHRKSTKLPMIVLDSAPPT